MIADGIKFGFDFYGDLSKYKLVPMNEQEKSLTSSIEYRGISIGLGVVAMGFVISAFSVVTVSPAAALISAIAAAAFAVAAHDFAVVGETLKAPLGSNILDKLVKSFSFTLNDKEKGTAVLLSGTWAAQSIYLGRISLNKPRT